MKDWWIYQGEGTPEERLSRLAGKQPPWRDFDGTPDPHYRAPGATGQAWERTARRGTGYVPDEAEIDTVNTALYLSRPLLVTGKPGVGKSTLAYSIATDLGLGPVLHWPITSRSTLRDGLYRYDAISRLHDANLQQLSGDGATGGPAAARPAEPDHSIAPYLRLGPLGTALLPQERPRVLLIDEIDKSDIDLPGDLLTVFEDGGFEIPELARIAAREPRVRIGTHDTLDTPGAPVPPAPAPVDPGPVDPGPVPPGPATAGPVAATVGVDHGRVQCRAFPVVVLTSNNERDFPPPFLRRCIRLHVRPPGPARLEQIIRQRLHLPTELDDRRRSLVQDLVRAFEEQRTEGDLATDQLLNAVQLRLSGAWSDDGERDAFLRTVLQKLTGPASP
ncbi:AAA family ATPase [Kitasatospora sp. NPDC090091]|uniref:AAA family ATPase n=1 Tax=Kitasatospora sp. NPDC090091 TaxID=3364081 RepID=UPI0038151EAD